MPTWFAAHAFWWAYRAGATISRAYLNWEAGRRGTTLEAAFEQAEFRRSRGQISSEEWALLQFVKFNDRWAWTDPKDFALDLSAFATAGLGLIAKVGLGNRILAVLGVKSAPTAGVLIDGIIDAVGGMLTGGKVGLPGVGDVLQAALEVLRGVQQTDAVKHGTNVVTATVKLGELLQPFLGISPEKAIPKAILSLPGIIDASVNLFGSLLGLWGAVEELLPEPRPRTAMGMRGDPPQTDPVFRNALAALEEEPPAPPAPPAPPEPDPIEIIFPVGPILDPTRELRRPGGAVPPPPVIDAETRHDFVRMFSNSFGGTGGSLRAVKGREAGDIFPFG